MIQSGARAAEGEEHSRAANVGTTVCRAAVARKGKKEKGSKQGDRQVDFRTISVFLINFPVKSSLFYEILIDSFALLIRMSKVQVL